MDPAQRCASTPCNRLLGLRLVDRAPGRAEVVLAARDDLRQEEGVIHGGILATLLDTAAVYAVHPDLPADQTMTSISFTVNFLAAAAPAGADVHARATVLRQGRTVVVCEAEASQDGTLVARGSFTYLLRPRRG
jgi:uncharacterized protein (TIGR00369 family)